MPSRNNTQGNTYNFVTHLTWSSSCMAGIICYLYFSFWICTATPTCGLPHMLCVYVFFFNCFYFVLDADIRFGYLRFFFYIISYLRLRQQKVKTAACVVVTFWGFSGWLLRWSREQYVQLCFTWSLLIDSKSIRCRGWLVTLTFREQKSFAGRQPAIFLGQSQELIHSDCPRLIFTKQAWFSHCIVWGIMFPGWK